MVNIFLLSGKRVCLEFELACDPAAGGEREAFCFVLLLLAQLL